MDWMEWMVAALGLMLLTSAAFMMRAWRLRERAVERAYRAEMAASVWKAQKEGWERAAEDWRQIAHSATDRNEALIDRMARMQREGFVEIPPLAEEPESMDGEPSESGEGWETGPAAVESDPWAMRRHPLA